MRENFLRSLAVTLGHEGGWADHPQDPGGATMKGITLKTYRRYRPGASKYELRNISDAEVERIYKRGYWDRVSGDQLPPGVDLVTFDGGVNSGPSRGAKWTQRACRAKADGKVGPLTLDAVWNVPAKVVVQRACDYRLGFVKGLRTWTTFGRGWARRIGEIRAHGLLWAGETPSQVRSDADRQEQRATTDNGKAAVAGGGGGVTAAPAVDPATFDWTQLAILGIGLGLIAIAVIYVTRAKARKEVARTMRAVANRIEGAA